MLGYPGAKPGGPLYVGGLGRLVSDLRLNLPYLMCLVVICLDPQWAPCLFLLVLCAGLPSQYCTALCICGRCHSSGGREGRG